MVLALGFGGKRKRDIFELEPIHGCSISYIGPDILLLVAW